MSDIIDEIQNTTHEYRKELERISRREARYRLSEAKRRLAARLGGMTP